jgi:hypothetical protein
MDLKTKREQQAHLENLKIGDKSELGMQRWPLARAAYPRLAKQHYSSDGNANVVLPSLSGQNGGGDMDAHAHPCVWGR